MASIPGFRFDITGASGSQGLLSPKSSWRAYILPRGGYASQDSTGTLITFDSAAVASRFAVNNWIQAGLSTANIRQVSAVGGNSLSVGGAALTIAENDRIYLVGNTQPTVSGGSATYTTPNTLIRQRDDDGSDLYTNSMITSNADGLIQGFAAVNFYDALIQDGNQSNQGSIIDVEVGAVSGASFEQATVFGATVTINGALGVTGTATFGATVTVNAWLVGNTITCATLRTSDEPSYNIMHPDYAAVGDGATNDAAAINAAITAANSAGGGVVLVPNRAFFVATSTSIDAATDVVLQGLGPQSSIFSSGARTDELIDVNGVSNFTIRDLTLHQTDQSSQFGCITIQGAASGIVVENCVIRDGYAGVWIKQGTGIRIINNRISNLSHPVYIGENEDPGGGDIKGVIIVGNDIYDAKTGGDAIKTIKTCHDITISNNWLHNNPQDGIDMFVSGDRVTITGNVIEGNTAQGLDLKSDEAGSSESLWGANRNCIISNNIIRSNVITGVNIARINDTDFPYFFNISNNVILGNSTYGIAFSVPYVTIANNLITGNCTSSASNYAGIYHGGLSGGTGSPSGCVISGNIIVNNGISSNLNMGVNLSSGLGPIVANNVFNYDPDLSIGSSQAIGININSGCTNSHIIGNHFGTGLSQSVLNNGTQTVFRANHGFRTESGGTASILSGTTTVTVTHGLAVTPVIRDISVTLNELPTNDPGPIAVSSITATQFAVSCRNDPGASNLDLGWRASVVGGA